MKRTKGSLVQETPVRLILLLFGFLTVGMLITSMFSGTSSFKDMLCKAAPYLPFCEENKEDIIARRSVNALACAINSVASGKQWSGAPCDDCDDCSEFYRNQEEGAGFTGFFNKIVGFATGSNKPSTSIECKENGNVECDCCVHYGEDEVIEKVIGSSETEVKKKCKDILKNSGFKDYYAGIYSKIKDCKKQLTCKIVNFQLPQEFPDGNIGENAERFITGNGDPKYLVYFQYFPEGENTDWQGFSPWYKNIGVLVFVTACVGHVLGPVIKWGAKELIPGANIISKGAGTKGIRSKIWRIISGKLGNKANNMLNKIPFFKSIGRKQLSKETAAYVLDKAIVDKYGTASNLLSKLGSISLEKKKLITNAFRKIQSGSLSYFRIASDLPDEVIKDSVIEMFGKKAGEKVIAAAPEVMKRVGITSLGAYVVSRIDSEIGKFLTQTNSLVLQSTMKDGKEYKVDVAVHSKPNKIIDPTQQNVVDLGKPIIMDKPEWRSGVTPLALASPCVANLTVEENKEVICGVYAYDSKNNIVKCDTPKETGWTDKLKEKLGTKIKKCGSLLNGLNHEEDKFYGDFMSKEIDVINNMDRVILTNTANIKRDLVCCKYIEIKSLPENARYAWVDRKICNEDNVWTEEEFKILEEGDPDYTKCGEKPKKEKEYKEIIDPINNMAFYYNIDEGRIEYYKNMSETEIYPVPDYFSGTNGECKVIMPKTKDEIKNLWGREEGVFEWVLGFDTEIFACSINLKTKKFGTVAPTTVNLNIKIYGNVTNDGNLERFYAVAIDYEKESSLNLFKHTTIVLRDLDNDNMVDEVDNYLWEDKIALVYSVSDPEYVIFTKNAIISTNCVVDSIVIRPSREKIGDYNYCYKKSYEGTLGLASMTLSFAGAAIAKVCIGGGFWGWAFGTAIDCGLAIAYLNWGKQTWPGSKY